MHPHLLLCFYLFLKDISIVSSFFPSILPVTSSYKHSRASRTSQRNADPTKGRSKTVPVPAEEPSWAWHALFFSSFADGIFSSEPARFFLKQGLNALMKHGSSSTTTTTTRYINQSPMRLLYIPTAMYAPRIDSENSLGKQRQRARADGKKRRTQIIQLIQQLVGVNANAVSAVTFDLDDGSIKQPEGFLSNESIPTTISSLLVDWDPNVLYMEGGNTFWLHHCLTKSTCVTDDDEAIVPVALLIKDLMTTPYRCVTMGASAGAIVAGAQLCPATWKQWDDPSVVPDMTHYDDWQTIVGQNVAGGTSFFPHYTPEWDNVLASKQGSVPQLVCLADADVACINGIEKSMTVLRGSTKCTANELPPPHGE